MKKQLTEKKGSLTDKIMRCWKKIRSINKKNARKKKYHMEKLVYYG